MATRALHLDWRGLLLWALVAAGAALRLSLIAGQRFHSDEALYSYWAQLIASGQDPLLLSVPLDKPPLFIYLLAGVFKLLGPGEVTARLIAEAASLAAVALTYTLGRRLYGQTEARLAAAVMALSPFNILFAPTAFTDALLVALVLAALALAAAGRWGWAGVAAGLAVATKQQGLLFTPLIAALGWVVAGKKSAWSLARLGLGWLSVLQILTGWDALRWHVRASFWAQSAASFGPLRLINGGLWGERLAGWSRLLGLVFGSPLLNAALLLGMPLLLWRSRQGLGTSGRAPLSSARADWLLAGFSALFFLAHWLLSLSVWDRYLLGLVPLAALLLARVAAVGAQHIAPLRAPAWRSGLVGLAVVVLLVGPAAGAVRGEYAIGGDHGAYQGLEQVMAFYRHQVPAGAVVLHRYLGWHYFYYLFDAPLKLRHYAEPAILAAKAASEKGALQYVTFPAWEKEAERETRAALATVGLQLVTQRQVWREDGRLAFTVYRIAATAAQSGERWDWEK